MNFTTSLYGSLYHILVENSIIITFVGNHGNICDSIELICDPIELPKLFFDRMDAERRNVTGRDCTVTEREHPKLFLTGWNCAELLVTQRDHEKFL